MNPRRTIIMTICFSLLCAMQLHAAEPAVEPQPVPDVAGKSKYRTPLAGNACRLTLFGEQVDVPVRDRCNTLAVALGINSFSPALGGADALPIAALYWRRESAHSRTRLISSVFVNELDHALKHDRFELLGHLENTTIPFPSAEIEDGREIKESSINWGHVAAWLGVGYRRPVAPFQMDNDLRVQIFYEGGYLYSGRTKDSGSQVRLPPDTYTHGLRLRVRYDGMRRNLMELLHEGFAAGMDMEWGRRQDPPSPTCSVGRSWNSSPRSDRAGRPLVPAHVPLIRRPASCVSIRGREAAMHLKIAGIMASACRSRDVAGAIATAGRVRFSFPSGAIR